MTQALTIVGNHFQASWPESLEPTTWQRVAEVAYDVFSAIIFPIGLVRLISRFIVWWTVVPMVLPATSMVEREHTFIAPRRHLPYTVDRGILSNVREYLKTTFSAEETAVMTPDGVRLNAMNFPGQNTEKYILFCNPNSTCYEQAAHNMTELAGQVGCSLFLFNPRGVVESEGYPCSSRDLSLDAYSCFEYLVQEKGIDPSNILIYGYSLGGGFGSEAAALAQEKYPDKPIMICNERSFESLSSEVLRRSQDLLGIPYFLGATASFLVRQNGWEMKSKECIDTLKGKKLIIYHKQDPIIPFATSLYHAMKEDRHGEITRIKLRDPVSNRIDRHGRALHEIIPLFSLSKNNIKLLERFLYMHLQAFPIL